MDVFQSSRPDHEGSDSAPITNYGTLGPNSDPEPPASGAAGPVSVAKSPRLSPFLAVALGALLAVLVGSIGRSHAAWSHFANSFSVHADESSPAASEIGRASC